LLDYVPTHPGSSETQASADVVKAEFPGRPAVDSEVVPADALMVTFFLWQQRRAT
jgi:hypothetical protein